MTSYDASIEIDGTRKPIKVIFSTGAEVSYISEEAAAQFRLPVFIEAKPTILQDIFGTELACTHTARVNVFFESHRHEVNVQVVPGGLPYLVLGMDWFQDYNPQISYRAKTMTFTDGRDEIYTIQTTTVKEKIVPGVRVVRS